eukprot:5496164-Pyramimonas_sp.AAC.1
MRVAVEFGRPNGPFDARCTPLPVKTHAQKNTPALSRAKGTRANDWDCAARVRVKVGSKSANLSQKGSGCC